MHMTNTTTPIAKIEVPHFLEDAKIWLVWRFEDSDTGKPKKVPYYASGVRRNGVQGSALERQQLATVNQAKVAAITHGFDGIATLALTVNSLLLILTIALMMVFWMKPYLILAMATTLKYPPQARVYIYIHKGGPITAIADNMRLAPSA